WKILRHCCHRKAQLRMLPVLLPLLLLAAVSGGTAQSIDDGFTQDCGQSSVQLDRYPPFSDAEAKYQRLMQPFIAADASRRQCPGRTVCAQKLVSVQDVEATYSEECWELNRIVEYTEVSCYADFCNTNITFGQVPSLTRKYFQASRNIPVKCYNHGQLSSMTTYRQILTPFDFHYRYAYSIPVSHWSRGMCGAAIYASSRRAYLVHERVLTGDREQKFAIFRICPRSGCNRQIVKDYLRNGYAS
ncbi:hypothetical protein BOX15_Mlig009359g1, partial [Macrostomum lignano]